MIKFPYLLLRFSKGLEIIINVYEAGVLSYNETMSLNEYGYNDPESIALEYSLDHLSLLLIIKFSAEKLQIMEKSQWH